MDNTGAAIRAFCKAEMKLRDIETGEDACTRKRIRLDKKVATERIAEIMQYGNSNNDAKPNTLFRYGDADNPLHAYIRKTCNMRHPSKAIVHEALTSLDLTAVFGGTRESKYNISDVRDALVTQINKHRRVQGTSVVVRCGEPSAGAAGIAKEAPREMASLMQEVVHMNKVYEKASKKANHCRKQAQQESEESQAAVCQFMRDNGKDSQRVGLTLQGGESEVPFFIRRHRSSVRKRVSVDALRISVERALKRMFQQQNNLTPSQFMESAQTIAGAVTREINAIPRIEKDVLCLQAAPKTSKTSKTQ
jgi:hypothetical protein